mmetsp:Transcript_35196/g.59026  ORF Transcript_35196/g.59026 Transcript_35196/m.59026 type:complete len:225 (+) Transcript_35196:2533-3207(+)
MGLYSPHSWNEMRLSSNSVPVMTSARRTFSAAASRSKYVSVMSGVSSGFVAPAASIATGAGWPLQRLSHTALSRPPMSMPSGSSSQVALGVAVCRPHTLEGSASTLRCGSVAVPRDASGRGDLKGRGSRVAQVEALPWDTVWVTGAMRVADALEPTTSAEEVQRLEAVVPVTTSTPTRQPTSPAPRTVRRRWVSLVGSGAGKTAALDSNTVCSIELEVKQSEKK